MSTDHRSLPTPAARPLGWLAKRAYNRVLRPHLPRKLGQLNGVTARHPKLFDRTEHFPEYEAELVAALAHTSARPIIPSSSAAASG